MEKIINLEDPYLAKIDVAHAFRNLRVDPADALKFGIFWKGNYYVDVALAFGWVHGCSAFQRASDAVVFLMKKLGHTIFAYIDDYIIISSEEEADRAFKQLSELLDELGLPMNPDKRVSPTKALTCLGINIDIARNILSIDSHKLRAIYDECCMVRFKKKLNKRGMQSLLGKLIYIHKCVKPARIFINRILHLFRTSTGRSISLSQSIYNDIDWFIRYLPSFNGVAYIQRDIMTHADSLYLDACLTGIGGVWASRVYTSPLHLLPMQGLTIVHYEMVNFIIALRLWGHFWRHSRVNIFSDNLAVVQVVTSGKTKDMFLATCIRNIWLLTAVYDIELEGAHIPGAKN